MSSTENEQHFFTCPSCSSILRTDAEFIGMVVQCPECGTGMEVPLPTHKTQKLKRPQRTVPTQRPTPGKRSKSTPVPEYTPPRRQPTPPPRRRTPTRRGAHRPPSRVYYGRPPAPAVQKLKDTRAQKVTYGVVGLILVILGVLWSQEKQVAASRIGRILPVSTDRNGVEVTGPPAYPQDTSSWGFHQRAEVATYQLGNAGRDSLNDLAVREDGRIIAAGMVSTRDRFPFTDIRTRELIDNRGSRNFGWVAEWSPDGREILWFSIFGGDLFEPRKIAIAPDGSIVLGGRALTRLPLTGTVSTGTGAVLMRLRFDGSSVEWIHAGERGQTQVSGLDIDDRGRIYWTADMQSISQTAHIGRIDRMGSPVPFGGAGVTGSLAFDPTSREFLAEGQAGAFYAKSKARAEGFDYDGPGGLPPVALFPGGVLGGGDLILLPTGDVVVAGTLHLDYKVKDQARRSTTDILVARFSPAGRLIWSTNLYGGMDSVHAPEQKAVDLEYNPATGEILVLAHQRGTQPHRLKGTFLGRGETATVSWIGRLDPSSGDINHGWYLHSASDQYDTSGFPAFKRNPLLNDTRLTRMAVDAQGRVYLTGMTGAHTWTSPQAWTSWPASRDHGSQGILIVMNGDLTRYVYSTLLNTSSHDSHTGFAGLVLNSTGIWVGGQTPGGGWTQGPRANWSRDLSGSHPHLSLAHFSF